MVKLGDYNLKNVEVFTGSEGYGLNAKLYKGKDLVAYVQDKGDGGSVNIQLNKDILEDSNSPYAISIIEDMDKLLALCGVTKTDGNLANCFRGNIYKSCEGFVEFIMTLREFKELSNQMVKKCGDFNYYALCEVGFSWFKNTDDVAQMFGMGVKSDNLDGAIEEVKRRLATENEILCGCFVGKGKQTFNVTFEEFAEIYKPFN